ncbi:MAG TPA: hypothetical protein VKT30_19710 [Caulobacteraceae bacterium]|nr:hypothetical protein [Caulobacteraceae bacterium]
MTAESDVTIMMPAFDRFDEEGHLVGRLLAAYGELELELAGCLIAVSGDMDRVVRSMFAHRGEERRIRDAGAMVGGDYDKAGLGGGFREALLDMHWCRTVRNQYAHCVWYDTPREGLCFCNLEAMALEARPINEIADGRRPIDVALLREQHEFFHYVRASFWHLAGEYKVWVGKLHKNSFPKPPRVQQPAKHR